MGTSTPPHGYVPIPGSRAHGWHKKVGSKWLFWYPDDEHDAKVSALKATQGNSALFLLKDALAHIGSAPTSDAAAWEMLSVGPGNWAPVAVEVAGHRSKVTAAVLGDAKGNHYSPHDIIGAMFHNADDGDHQYHVAEGETPGTYSVERFTSSAPGAEPEHVDNVPAHILQAMMSRWIPLTQGSVPAVTVDALGHAWAGEDRVFKEGAAAADAAPLFERVDILTAKAMVAALKGKKVEVDKKITAAESGAVTAPVKAKIAEMKAQSAALGDSIAKVQAYAAAFKAMEDGKKKAVLDVSHGHALAAGTIFGAEAAFFSSPEGRALQLKLAGGKYDTEALWHAYESKAPTGTVLVDNTEALKEFQEGVSGFAKDGPMLRGKDNALYTSETWNFDDMTLEYKENLSRAFWLMKEKKKLGKKWGEFNQKHGAEYAALSAYRAEIDKAVFSVVHGATTSVHYPHVSSNPSTYTRQNAVLTILGTRRPPPYPIKSGLIHRGVRLSAAAVAGLHAGMTFSLNSGASTSLKEIVGGVSPAYHGYDATNVTYVFPKAAMGIDVSNTASICKEQEVIAAGTYAIERIEYHSGYGMVDEKVWGKKVGKTYTYGSQKRLLVRLRALTPQELSGLGIKHGGAEPELTPANREIQVAIWAADVEAHAWEKYVRAFNSENGHAKLTMADTIGKGGGWATRADALQAQTNAIEEVAARGGSVLFDKHPRIASPPLEVELKRTLAIFEKQGYNEGKLGEAITLDMRAGRYKRALDTMRKAMEGKTPPRGFVPDGTVKGVWVKFSNGEAVQYWKAGNLFTPEEYAKNFMGEFDASAKIASSAAWGALDALAKSGKKVPGVKAPVPEPDPVVKGDDPGDVNGSTTLFTAPVVDPMTPAKACKMCGTPMRGYCPSCGSVDQLNLQDVFSVNGGGPG